MSISGISGVATKTSFALFLLYSIFQSGVLGKRSVNAKALVFSVKGEDLLFLDHRNRRLDGDLRRRLRRARACPRSRSRRWASSPRRRRTTRAAARSSRAGPAGVTAFWWTLAEFCAGELLPYVFADAEDERNQYTMVIHRWRRGCGGRRPAVGDGAVSVEGQILRTYDALVEFVSDRLERRRRPARDWAGPVTGTGTVNAFLRRLRSLVEAAARASCAATCPTRRDGG